MFRAAALMFAGVLAGCGHSPVAHPPAASGSPAGCVPAGGQASWRAETAPVIDKRQGQEALDVEDGENGEGQKPCP